MDNIMNNKKRNAILVVVGALILAAVILIVVARAFKPEEVNNNSVNSKQENMDNNEVNSKQENTDNNSQDINQEENNNGVENSQTSVENNNGNDTITEDDVYWIVNNDIITQESTVDFTFKIVSNGEISINDNKKITNINNAKSIKLFSPPWPSLILYILTNDGKIYKYETSEYAKGNYTAIHMDNYSNINEIVTRQKRSTRPVGGCDYIVVVDKDGKQFDLDSYCV